MFNEFVKRSVLEHNMLYIRDNCALTPVPRANVW